MYQGYLQMSRLCEEKLNIISLVGSHSEKAQMLNSLMKQSESTLRPDIYPQLTVSYFLLHHVSTMPACCDLLKQL